MEMKDPKSTESASASQRPESKDPKSDATSDATLSDVEDTEKLSETSKKSETSGNEPSAVPSPDGAFDEGHSESGGIEDAGPM